MDSGEVVDADVCVALGGGEVAVSEHGLDGAEVGAVFEHVGGHGVAGEMAVAVGDACVAEVFGDDASDVCGADRCAVACEEQGGFVG